MKDKLSVAAVLGRAAKKHWALSLLMLAAVAAAALLALVPPLVLERIVNALAARQPVPLALAALYAAAVGLSALTDTARESMVTLFGQKATHALRSAMSDKLSRLPSGFFVEREPGVTASIMVNDVGTVESLFTSGIISMAADLIRLGGILYVIFTRSRGLALMLAVLTPFLMYLTRRFQKGMLAAQMDNRAAVARINQMIPEALNNLRTIRLLQKEEYMLGRYGEAIGQSYRAQERSNFYDAVYSPIIVSLSALLVGVVMALSARGGAFPAFFGLSAGAAAAVIAYVGSFFGPLESIGMEIQSVQSAVAGVKRINAFLSEQEKRPTRAPVEETRWAVQVRGLTFRYGREDKPILHGFGLTVAEGETVVLAGRTGAGKSTLVKLIAGLYPPDEGEVRVFGMAPDAIAETQRRRLLGYVEQRFRMVPGTVAEQVSLKDAQVTRPQVEQALKLVGLWDAVALLPRGMDTPCAEGLLSQGQFELLSIARAVVLSPRLLLMDEITADLDARTEREVLSALRAASEGRTVISVSHRLYAAQNGARVRRVTL